MTIPSPARARHLDVADLQLRALLLRSRRARRRALGLGLGRRQGLGVLLQALRQLRVLLSAALLARLTSESTDPLLAASHGPKTRILRRRAPPVPLKRETETSPPTEQTPRTLEGRGPSPGLPSLQHASFFSFLSSVSAVSQVPLSSQPWRAKRNNTARPTRGIEVIAIAPEVLLPKSETLSRPSLQQNASSAGIVTQRCAASKHAALGVSVLTLH